jgi:hypothetical protein
MVLMVVLMVVLLVAVPHHMGMPGSHDSPGHAPAAQQQDQVSKPAAEPASEKSEHPAK